MTEIPLIQLEDPNPAHVALVDQGTHCFVV